MSWALDDAAVVGLGVVGDVVGFDVVGLDVVGSDVVGLDVVGLDAVGFNVVGLDVVGLDVVGLNVVGTAVVGLALGLDVGSARHEPPSATPKVCGYKLIIILTTVRKLYHATTACTSTSIVSNE